MNSDSPHLRGVAIVPRRPRSRVIFGEEVLLAPKTAFTILIDEGLEAAAHVAAAQTEAAASNARRVLEDVADAGALRAKKYPRSPTAWQQAGFADLARGDHTAAAQSFERALELDPHSRSALLGLARSANEAGDHARAIQLLEGLRAELPDDPEVRVALAVAVCDAEGIEASLEVLRDDPPLSGRAASFFAARGSLWVAAGEYRKAIRDLRKAVRMRPHWAHACNVLGIAELKSGAIVAAERRFRETVRVAPMYMEGYLNLLRVLMLQEKFASVLDLSADRYPDMSSAPARVGRIVSQAALALEEWIVARTWLESAIGKSEEPGVLARLQNDLGVVLSRLNRHEDAEKRFKASFEATPMELNIVNRAKALLRCARPLEAVEWLSDAPLPDGLTSRDRRVTLASAFQGAKLHQDAVLVYEELIESGEAESSEFAILSGIYTDHLEDLESAIRVARAGLERDPGSAWLINNLGYALAMAGRTEDASEVLARPMHPATDHERVCLMATRGLVEFRRGAVDAGRRLYDEALAIAQTDGMRERVRAKRDLEFARALGRTGAPASEVAKLLERAASASEAAYPYSIQAQHQLRQLRAGDG